jgi:hypothetical protein
MPEIGTSGSMSGDGKRSVAAWPKLPRPSSTLPWQNTAHGAVCPQPAKAAIHPRPHLASSLRPNIATRRLRRPIRCHPRCRWCGARLVLRCRGVRCRSDRDTTRFAELLDRIEGNGVRVVLVEDASRFARDVLAMELGLLMLNTGGLPWAAWCRFMARGSWRSLALKLRNGIQGT